MKRSNFTFLFLFALLSFVSTETWAQSSSTACAAEVNVAIDADCTFQIDNADLSAASATTIVIDDGTATGSGAALGTSNVFTLEPGKYKYTINVSGLTNGCWGYINFEQKMVPELVPTSESICCGEDLDEAWPDFNLDDYLSGGCYADIENVQTTITASGGDVCDTIVNVRTITGTYDVDGSKETVTLARDTVRVVPIPLTSICAPTEEVTLSCELIAGIDFADADAVAAATTPSALSTAYSAQESVTDGGMTNWVDTLFFPYLKKDTLFQEGVFEDFTVAIDTIRDSLMLNIDGVWTLQDVVTKDTTFFSVPAPPDTVVFFTKIPKGNTCNINAKCTDMVLEGPCGGLPMIMRTWSVINWCDKSDATYQQWIIFEDDQDPEDLTISGNTELSIAPWTCAATASLTASADDWGAIDYTWSTSAGTISADGASATISNLWCAESPITVTVRATDGCGNYSEETIDLTVVDNVAPVAVAEDQVNVSLIPDGAGAGIAKVYKDAIDAGSHDAGCGEVQTCVLLKSEWLAPIEDADGNHVRVNESGSVLDAMTPGGKHIYEAAQCASDGTYTYTTEEGKTSSTSSIPYVICKDYVKFCCDDQGEHEVALVVTDAGSECLGDNHPNVSFAWGVVNVEDKSQGAINPGMIMADCDAPTSAQLLAAISSSTAICESSDTFTAGTPEGPDGCGYGEEVVSIYNAAGEEVTTVTVVYKGAEDADKFDPTTIKWPKHQTGKSLPGVRRECESGVIAEYRTDVEVAMGSALDCNDMGIVGEPVWCQPTCALVGANYEDDFDNSDSESCKTVIRRHTIIDWCTWEPNGDNVDDENDTSTDSFEAVDDEWLPNSVLANAAVGDDCEDCEKTSGTADDVYFRYTSVEVDGYYTFDQVIKIIDETAPVIAAVDTVYVDITGGADSKTDDTACTGSDIVEVTASDLCGEDVSDSNITWWISRTGVDADDAVAYGTDASMGTGAGSPGDEAVITWTARDNCGNSSEKTTVVIFRDTKNPTPICIQDISTAVMQNGSIDIWAADFNFQSYDNCGAIDDITISLDEDGAEEGYSINFTCEDLTGPVTTVALRMHVYDESGNTDFCRVFLQISANDTECTFDDVGSSALISGVVRTELGDMIESAKVSLNKTNVDFTSVEGKYAFGNTPMYNAYEITSNKDDDYMNGVSTLDLVLIQKHVLGIEALNSPFKVIAADINSDTRISAADLVELRKLILGVYTELPTNDSWRFVDAGETFDDANDPFPFTEALNVTLDAATTDQDFIGVKIGDVSGNAIANSLIAAGTRSVGTLELAIADADLISGNEVSVAVSAKNFNNISAYQFTMDVAGLEFVSVESGAINVTDDNFAQLDANTITTAWYNSSAISADDVLFTITFKATANVRLSDALAINSKVTEAAAYTSGLEKLDVDVAFNGIAGAEFALFQNEPNPFDNGTTISFQLAEAGAATLTVFDVTGKAVSILRGEYAKGFNSISVTKADLNATGVLYYQLESGDNIATKKMIVIE